MGQSLHSPLVAFFRSGSLKRKKVFRNVSSSAGVPVEVVDGAAVAEAEADEAAEEADEEEVDAAAEEEAEEADEEEEEAEEDEVEEAGLKNRCIAKE